MDRLSMIKSRYFELYKKKQPITILKHFNKIKSVSLSTENFNFYFSNSAVYSSMIEGNIIDFDSYLKYSHSNMNNKGKSFMEIEDLKNSYKYAQSHKLNYKNFLEAHKKLSKTIILESKYNGQLRDKNVFVFKDGQKIFTGAAPSILESEMKTLFADIKILLKRDLSISEVFYFASIIHLIMVQIHPFADGNGRASRLIEKWFLAEKLGQNAWFIQSERLYQKRLLNYYKNVNIGSNYTIIDYDYSIPFLLMLPMALRLK